MAALQDEDLELPPVDAYPLFEIALTKLGQSLSRLSLPPDAIEAAVDILRRDRGHVVCCGVGKSGHVASKIAATMSSLGIPAIAMNPSEAAHGDLGVVRTRAPVLLFSNSGSTAEIVSILPALRARRCRLIGIVGSENSVLASACQVVLCFGTAEEIDEFTLAPTTSTLLQMAIGDALAVAVSRIRGFQKDEFFLNHPAGALGRRMMKAGQVMRSGDRVPVNVENAPLAAVIAEMSAKRIGLTCVIDSKRRLLGIVTDGDIRRVLQERRDIYRMLASDLLQRHPSTVQPETLVGEVASGGGPLLQHLAMPVVDSQNGLLGVLVGLDLI